MALNTGFPELNSANSTFSDWLNKTNEMIVLFRNNALTASNGSIDDTFGDCRLYGDFVANNIVVPDSLRGGTYSTPATMTITSNTTFSAAAANVYITNDLSVGSDLVVSANAIVNLLTFSNDGGANTYVDNADPNLIVTSNDIYFVGNTHITGNFDVSGSMTASDLTVSGTLSLTDINVSNNATFFNMTVDGQANIASLDVGGLTANGVAMTGVSASVSNTAPEVIDSFAKTITKGFKYIIQGDNGDAASAFSIEIMCAHNDTNLYYTRYAEVSNNFNVTLVPSINGANVELTATCGSASGANVHNFSIMKIEAR